MSQKPKPGQCSKRVYDRFASMGFRFCTFDATKDGFCAVHHPDAKKERDAKALRTFEAKALAESVRRIRWALSDLEPFLLPADVATFKAAIERFREANAPKKDPSE